MSELLKPRIDLVPGLLTSLNQWVVWRAREVTKKGPDGTLVSKITKIPYNPNTGRQASSMRPRTWASFDKACESYLIDGYDGIGFVFSPNDNLVGIDLDDCFEEDGSLKPSAQLAVSLIDSFTEKSPSGKGLHIICEAKLPGTGHCDKKHGREMYQEGRFFTITAEIVDGQSQVAERYSEARELYEEWWGSGSFENYEAGDLQWDPGSVVSDLRDLSVSDYVKNLITNGEAIDDFTNEDGLPDRSAALFYVCREMVSAGVNKETILTVLTDGDNYLGQPALERRSYDTESAQDWVWKYTLAKVISRWEEELGLFDDVLNIDDVSEDEADDDGKGETEGLEEPDPIPFEKGNFEKNALLFLRDVKPLVRCSKDNFCWTGTHWKLYTDEQIERDIQIAMKGRGFQLRDFDNTIKTVRRFATKDSFKPNPTIVNFKNGAIDLAGWDGGMVFPELMPHNKKHRSTSCLSFDYDASAKCPQWMAFLRQISIDDNEWIRLLQQFMGYCLVYDLRWHKMLMLSGESRSGKGVITHIIQELLGAGAYAGVSLSSLAGEFGLEQLMHKKVAVIGDAHKCSKDKINRAKEVLLNVTSGDPIPFNRKHKGEITTQLPSRLIMLANDIPRFVDSHDALMNRYLVLPFTLTFAGREDVNLTSKLKKEMPGIFNFALDGLLDLALTGSFVEPKSAEPRKDEIRMHQNPVAWFARKFMVQSESNEHMVLCDDLYDYFCAFCREIDMKPMSSVWFGRHLAREASYAQRTRRRSDGGARDYFYSNLEIDREAISEFLGDDWII